MQCKTQASGVTGSASHSGMAQLEIPMSRAIRAPIGTPAISASLFTMSPTERRESVASSSRAIAASAPDPDNTVGAAAEKACATLSTEPVPVEACAAPATSAVAKAVVGTSTAVHSAASAALSAGAVVTCKGGDPRIRGGG